MAKKEVGWMGCVHGNNRSFFLAQLISQPNARARKKDLDRNKFFHDTFILLVGTVRTNSITIVSRLVDCWVPL